MRAGTSLCGDIVVCDEGILITDDDRTAATACLLIRGRGRVVVAFTLSTRSVPLRGSTELGGEPTAALTHSLVAHS